MEIPDISIPEIYIPNVPAPYTPHYLSITKPPDIDESMPTYPEFSVMTNLSCSKCFSEVEILKKRDAFD